MRLNMAANEVIELAFTSTMVQGDPYNSVELNVLFTGPDGHLFRVPAFWAGGNRWKVRFAASKPGRYVYLTEASCTDDAGLHGVAGEVEIYPAQTVNPLFQHGRLRVGSDKRHFEHEDGTPFFWVADTWWMGLCTRLDWPRGFKELTADRVAKGFNTIQIIAGPYPDMDQWDPRGRNEAGFPFKEGNDSINPDYFDQADLRIAHLVHSGLMPCIVGMWGYYLPSLGVERVKRFWRYLVARYGAYPVVWCTCGEGTMPWYLTQTREEDVVLQREGWSQVMAYLREVDCFHNLITIHPTQYGREQVTDPGLMDFEMLQTGHSDVETVDATIATVETALQREPVMPVIDSEVNYEGILGRCWQNVQRLCFYHAVLRGTAGHTYGGNGIWQMSTLEHPYGASPHGRSWGSTPWVEAAQLPGSRQTGIGGRFIQRFPWWKLEVHTEWLDPSRTGHGAYDCIAVGIPKELRIVYVPMCWDPPKVFAIEPNVAYRAYWFDPVTGIETTIGEVDTDETGCWTPPLSPEVHDWLLVMTVV